MGETPLCGCAEWDKRGVVARLACGNMLERLFAEDRGGGLDPDGPRGFVYPFRPYFGVCWPW